MNLLLKKELRLVMPASLAVIALAWTFAFMFLAGQDGSVFLALLLAGGAAAGALGYGQEMEHQTLDMQLSVPISRKRIWWTKLAALALGVLPLCLHLWMFFHYRAQVAPGALASYEPYLLWTALSGLSASLFTWKLGSIIGGASVGGILSIVWFGLVEPTLWTKVVVRTSEEFAKGTYGEWSRLLMSAALVGAVAVIHYRSWMRGEIRSRRSAEEGMHNWSLTRTGMAPHPRRPWLNLVVKEVRLQTPAIFVAIVCSLFTLISFAGRGLLPESLAGLDAYKAGIGVLTAIVPLLAGCTALAEERTLRSLQPLIALPRSWARVFQLKAVTSCALALLLGAGLPLVLEKVSGGSDLNPPILAAIVFSTWVIGFFAGSISTGTVRAVLFACAFTVLVAFLWIPWGSGTRFGFMQTGVQDFVLGVWQMIPGITRGEDGHQRAVDIVRILALTLGVLTASLLLVQARKLGRQPDVTRRQIVAAVAVILVVTTPLAMLVTESIVAVERIFQ